MRKAVLEALEISKSICPCVAAVETSGQRVVLRARLRSASLLLHSFSSRCSLSIGFVVRGQCHGVHVEKQCPQCEELFLCCGMAQRHAVQLAELTRHD